MGFERNFITGRLSLTPECMDFLVGLDHDAIMKAFRKIHRSDRMSSYQLHILWASCFGFHEELDSLFKLFISCQLGDCQGAKAAMFSVLEMSKYDCITKVGCDKFVVLVAKTLLYFFYYGNFDFLFKICHTLHQGMFR